MACESSVSREFENFTGLPNICMARYLYSYLNVIIKIIGGHFEIQDGGITIFIR